MEIVTRAVRDASTIECNSSNHWPDGVRPVDYDEVSAATYARHWLPAWHPEAHIEPLTKSETAWLRRARLAARVSGVSVLTRLFQDELDALAAAHAPFAALLQSRDLFVRCENVSLKYGVHGCSAPLKTLRAVVESLVTSDAGHDPLADVETVVTLYAVPWEPRMCAKAEWRVFVYNRRVTAVSQQVWYKSVGHTAASATHAARLIVDFMQRTVLPRLARAIPQSVVADVAVFDDDTCMFIEINPFGAAYTSGSALFHWVHDAHLLCNFNAAAPVTVAFVE